MRIFLSFFLCMSVVTAHAQFSTNVYRTDQSGQDPGNVIYYSSERPLAWSDFKGQADPPGPVAALTTSGFGYKAHMTTSNGKGQFNIGVYCFFSKDQSWVRTGRNTSYILTHEQHHFDVSYIAANIFMDKVRSANLTPSNFNTILPRLYRECCDFMNKMQNDYDGQTLNGQLEDVQKKWNSFFEVKLNLFTGLQPTPVSSTHVARR